MIVLSLFDYTGIMVKPWADAGHECICVDIQHKETPREEGNISYIKLDLMYNPDVWDILYEMLVGKECFIMGFPVCTHLANSGAKHWEIKRQVNPNFQINAALPAKNVEALANRLGARLMVENPRGALSQLWRKEDYTFDPCDYGQYLPPDDEHPLYPDIIPGRDAYQKITCIWGGNGFIMPPKLRVNPVFKLYRRGNGEILKVSPIVAKTGGDSAKTKNVRSATPRGFALAVYYANGISHADN